VTKFVIFVRPSVRTEQLVSHWTDFHEIWYINMFQNLSIKFNFYLNRTRITVLHMKTKIFDHISLSASENEKCSKLCRENQSTHFVSNTPLSEIHGVYEVMYKNIVDSDRPHVIIRRMRSACCITTATYTHSELRYLSLSTAIMVARTRLSVMLYVNYLFCLCLVCCFCKWPSGCWFNKLIRNKCV